MIYVVKKDYIANFGDIIAKKGTIGKVVGAKIDENDNLIYTCCPCDSCEEFTVKIGNASNILTSEFGVSGKDISEYFAFYDYGTAESILFDKLEEDRKTLSDLSNKIGRLEKALESFANSLSGHITNLSSQVNCSVGDVMSKF